MTEPWVTDAKTSAYALNEDFFDKFSPDNQMSCYSTAAQIAFGEEVKGVLVDGIQVAVNFTRFQRGFARRSRGQLEEWMHDTLEWIGIAEHYAHRQSWPMNDKSCSNYGGCVFRDICGKSPSIRQKFLKSDFTKKTWNP